VSLLRTAFRQQEIARLAIEEYSGEVLVFCNSLCNCGCISTSERGSCFGALRLTTRESTRELVNLQFVRQLHVLTFNCAFCQKATVRT